GAAVMTLLYGWFFAQAYGEHFGLLVCVVLVSFASTSGATLAFLASRYILGEPIQRKFGEQLTKFNVALDREGPFYLFTLRLIPAVPFFVINLVMGLTRIGVGTFWWVSQVGMLPGTIVYVYAGTKLPGPKDILENGAGGILSIDILIAFGLLAAFPFVVRAIMKRVRPNT
ncbi:MAG: VTT domain-containing protein, partial [Pirellulales bacterium]|nr:VTT domain-containing protein [Pirellulales bacterium]